MTCRRTFNDVKHGSLVGHCDSHRRIDDADLRDQKASNTAILLYLTNRISVMLQDNNYVCCLLIDQSIIDSGT